MTFNYLHNRKFPLFFLVPVLALMPVSLIHAQTCKITCGVNNSGTISYKEVFEYDYVTDKPSFPGGSTSLLQFLNKHRQYPEEAYRKGVQGRVTCQFVVNTDGSVTDIQLLRGVHPDLNREAIRLFSIMPAWVPGKHNGRTVPVRVIWSVPFRR